jgi:hypothetical protein
MSSRFFDRGDGFRVKKDFLLSHVKIIGSQNGFIIRVFFYNAESVVFQKKFFFTQLMRHIRYFHKVTAQGPKFGFFVPTRASFYRPKYKLFGTRTGAFGRLAKARYLKFYAHHVRRRNSLVRRNG